MLLLTVNYYASLREQRGVSCEAIRTESSTPADLYEELQGKHGFTLHPTSLRVAINDEFARMDQQLKDGDVVTFISPVAGG